MGTLTINWILGPHWSSNPNVTLANAVLAKIATDMQNIFQPVNNVNIGVNVDWGFCNGQSVTGSTLASSQQPLNDIFFTWSTYRSSLLALSTNNSLAAVAFTSTNMPSTNPLGSTTFTAPIAFKAAIGANVAINNPTTAFAFIGYNTAGPWDWTSDGSTCAGGTYSFYGATYHELSECLGRFCDGPIGGTGNLFVEDWWTWSGTGTHSIASTGDRFLAATGATPILYCNQNTSADVGDYDPTHAGAPGNSCCDAFADISFAPSRSSSLPLQQYDIQAMALIGWPLTPFGITAAGLTAPGVPTFYQKWM